MARMALPVLVNKIKEYQNTMRKGIKNVSRLGGCATMDQLKNLLIGIEAAHANCATVTLKIQSKESIQTCVDNFIMAQQAIVRFEELLAVCDRLKSFDCTREQLEKWGNLRTSARSECERLQADRNYIVSQYAIKIKQMAVLMEDMIQSDKKMALENKKSGIPQQKQIQCTRKQLMHLFQQVRKIQRSSDCKKLSAIGFTEIERFAAFELEVRTHLENARSLYNKVRSAMRANQIYRKGIVLNAAKIKQYAVELKKKIDLLKRLPYDEDIFKQLVDIYFKMRSMAAELNNKKLAIVDGSTLNKYTGANFNAMKWVEKFKALYDKARVPNEAACGWKSKKLCKPPCVWKPNVGCIDQNAGNWTDGQIERMRKLPSKFKGKHRNASKQKRSTINAIN